MLSRRYPHTTQIISERMHHNRTGHWLQFEFETSTSPGKLRRQLFALEKVGPCWDVWPVSQINSSIKSEGIRVQR